MAVIVVVIIVAAAWGLYLYNKPHTDVNDIQPSVTTTATDIYNEFQQDENAANKKYLDKVVAVKGVVAEVEKSDTTMNILLKAGDGMDGVNCSMSKNSINKLSVHSMDAVTIKGRCAGFLLDVSLVDCVIEK